MLEFITRFFRREEASKTLAKERLRLVLMSDRVSLAPDVFDEMKSEMLGVIGRYLEIDEAALDMHFETLERQFALLASIPILKVKNRQHAPVGKTNGVHAGGTVPAAPRTEKEQPAAPMPAFEPFLPHIDAPANIDAPIDAPSNIDAPSDVVRQAQLAPHKSAAESTNGKAAGDAVEQRPRRRRRRRRSTAASSQNGAQEQSEGPTAS